MYWESRGLCPHKSETFTTILHVMPVKEQRVQEEPLQDPNHDVLVVLNTTEGPYSLLRWIS